jgi:Kef-type K+ transport system membrane component KefB
VESIFFEIAVVIILASALTILFRYLRQPSILAYILTGIILGPLGIFHLQNKDALQTFGQLGITLLLFMLGLELKLHELRSIGKTAIIAGTLQMVGTFALGFGLSLLLGFPQSVSVYLGIALAFSSTIIIVKLLSDKKDLNSLHGKLALGILLMQDFFAILTIIFLGGVPGGGGVQVMFSVLLVLLKIVVLAGWIVVLSTYVFPRLIHSIAKSPESLFLFSLAWVFALTAIVTSKPIGFSIEIGGFLAGLALANSAENYQIVAKMKSLRDFFITIFFVTLGLEMHLTNLGSVILPAIVFSLFVLLIKPFLVMAITGMMGFRKRTSFFVGSSLAQVSEFSLIILFLAAQKGLLGDRAVTTIVLVAMITFTVSTYIIQNANRLYKQVGRWFFVPESHTHNTHESIIEGEFDLFDKHVILIGGKQMGSSILHAFKNSGEQILVVDFDPDIVKKLKNQGVPVFFGDISDIEIQERAGFQRAKLVISTVPDLEDNLLLVEGLNHTNKRAKVVVMAYEAQDAKALYKAGADYVVLPHLAGGHHLAKILVDSKYLEMIEKYKAKDLEYLK